MLSVLTCAVCDKTRLLIKFVQGKKLWNRTSKASFRLGITGTRDHFLVLWSNGAVWLASIQLLCFISKTRLATCRLPTENRAWLGLLTLLHVGLNSDRDHAHHLTLGTSKGELSGLCPNPVCLTRIDGRHGLTWYHKQNVLSSRNHIPSRIMLMEMDSILKYK